MQKYLQISIFILLNTLLSPIITIFIAALYLGSIIVVDDPKEIITPYIYILMFFFIMRIITFPIFYTLIKSINATNSILLSFFNLLKKNNIYTTLFLLFIFCVDIAISYIFLYIFIFDKNLISFNSFIINYLIGGYGLLFAYLSLLCWLRIIEEKFNKKTIFNITVSLLFLIMAVVTFFLIVNL